MLMIEQKIKGKNYKQLINLLAKHCDRFAFVERELEEERLKYIDEIASTIQVHLLDRKRQRKWETTRLAGGTAYVFYFQLNNATRDFLKERSNSLFDWLGPELPEDLMFYKGDKCVLAACSHEGFFLVDEALWKKFESLN